MHFCLINLACQTSLECWLTVQFIDIDCAIDIHSTYIILTTDKLPRTLCCTTLGTETTGFKQADSNASEI